MKTNLCATLLLSWLILSLPTTVWAFAGNKCHGETSTKCSWMLPKHVGFQQLYASRTELRADLLRANLVSGAKERLLKKMGSAGAIQLTNSDFTTFAQPGNTQLTYTGSSGAVTFEMVIGQADLVNSQSWTLPADLTNQLDNVQRRDFINPTAIPVNLRLPGVTHAMKYVAGNRLYTGYRQFQIGSTAVNFLGVSVDRKVGTDFETVSPNALFSVLPLMAGSTYNSQSVYDDPDDDLREIQSDTLTFNGFGSLRTPNGTFQALRYTIKSGLRTYDLSGGGSPSNANLIDVNTSTQVGWVTKEGYWIVAEYTGYNPTTKAAMLRNVTYTAIVPTASLLPTFTNSCNCPR